MHNNNNNIKQKTPLTGQMWGLIFTSKFNVINWNRISGRLITCVPFCSFTQQHVSSEPQVLATDMKNHSTFKSEQMLEALDSEGKTFKSTLRHLIQNLLAIKKTLVHHKNNSWLLLLCMYLIIRYILKNRNPESWSITSSRTYPRNRVLERSLHHCPVLFWHPK